MIVAAMPVKNNIGWTAPLVDQLLLADSVDEIWIYDNASTDETKFWIAKNAYRQKICYVDASTMRFYEMWNHMIASASKIGNVKLAMLNNDIRLPHMALKTMADHMEGYQIAQVDGRKRSIDPIKNPLAAEIRWTERIGHAFMVDADFWKDKEYAVNPELNIWYGDDDLFLRCVRNGGKICEIQGVGCDHAWHQTYQYYSGDLKSDIHRDRDIFLKTWNT